MITLAWSWTDFLFGVLSLAGVALALLLCAVLVAMFLRGPMR